jgi:hypothetical protein
VVLARVARSGRQTVRQQCKPERRRLLDAWHRDRVEDGQDCEVPFRGRGGGVSLGLWKWRETRGGDERMMFGRDRDGAGWV